MHSLFFFTEVTVKARDLSNLDSKGCPVGNASTHAERLENLPSTHCYCTTWLEDNRASVTGGCLLASPSLPRVQR
jgi:hypothetical protein